METPAHQFTRRIHVFERHVPDCQGVFVSYLEVTPQTLLRGICCIKCGVIRTTFTNDPGKEMM